MTWYDVNGIILTLKKKKSWNSCQGSLKPNNIIHDLSYDYNYETPTQLVSNVLTKIKLLMRIFFSVFHSIHSYLVPHE